MRSEAEMPAMLCSVRAGKRRSVIDQPYYDLIFGLQATLDLSELLEIFNSHLERAVPHEGYRYSNPELGIEISTGRRCLYACQYDLQMDEHNLGQLTVTRERVFSEDDLATIEAYFCRLLFPIRNALMYRQAVDSAYLDPLTGTRNRAALLGCLRREWEMAKRYSQPLSAIMLDVDHFKTINDTYGHSVGDSVLQTVAQIIAGSVRTSDLLFRYGGEEFLVLLAGTGEDAATQLADRIRTTLERRICLPGDGLTIRLTASLGVACLNHGELAETLVHRADQALYRAKAAGRNRVALARGERNA
ncbi:MAG: GGDEF domain-containing protein [Methylococcaceae bacterium]|nr:GGDEF domain-containing protein [Methylococcaceae bacterium]